jgi:translocation and assembly module TamB
MPEKKPEPETRPLPEAEAAPKKRRRGWRPLWFALAGLLGVALLVCLAVFLIFRLGYVDQYAQDALRERLAEFGIKAELGKVETTISPTTAEFQNLVFFDEQTGEKLAIIDRLKIGLTVSNIIALNSTRTISVDSTDVEGLEVWVKFDEQGRSNFANLKFKFEDDPNLKVSLAALNFNLKDAIVHYGDLSRKLSGTAKNIVATAEAVENDSPNIPEDDRRFKFDIASENSTFVYVDRPIEPIDIRAIGVAGKNGAEISELNIKSPLGTSTLQGTIEDWEKLRYNFKIDSNVDLRQTAETLPAGVALRGFGGFKGTVSGEGENYRVEGEIASDALAADNVRLKALQINAKATGSGSTYEANGKAVAELLTAGDYELSWLQIAGQIRGTGTDLRWFGELKAAAAKTPEGTIANLILSDAVAEYQEKKFGFTAGQITARSFINEDAEVAGLTGSNARASYINGKLNVNLPSARAASVKARGIELRGVNAGNVMVEDGGNGTSAQIGTLRAENFDSADAKLKNLSAGNVKVNTKDLATNVTAQNVQAERLEAEGAKVAGLSAGSVEASVKGNQTAVNAENLRADSLESEGAKVTGLSAGSVATSINGNQTAVDAKNLRINSLAAEGAVLGSLNIAGARLTMRQGRIEGSSSDIAAGDVTLTKTASNPGGKLENVSLGKPFFVLEPSGRYRATMDLSLGGGVLGSLKIGAARANAVITNEQLQLDNLSAQMMDGRLDGSAVIATNNKANSKLAATFSNLDLAKILALQGGKVVPIAGKTSGKTDLTFPGTNFRAASGTLTADFMANAGTAERGLIPLDGKLIARATNGLFDIDSAYFRTEKSEATARGRFDLDGGGSALNIALNSSDAGEVQRLVKVLGVSSELDQQLAELDVELGGAFRFDGNLSGDLSDPQINGNASLALLQMRKRELGSLTASIAVTPDSVKLTQGVLAERGGGTVAFDIDSPRSGKDNISVVAQLSRINTENLLAALPLDKYLPEAFRDFQAETSGSLVLRGLPDAMTGEAALNSTTGSIGGEPFDGFDAKLKFENDPSIIGNLARIERLQFRFGEGFLSASGTYNRTLDEFDLRAEGKALPVSRIRPFISRDPDFPKLSGLINLQASGKGKLDDTSTYNINFEGAGRDFAVNENQVGNILFRGETVNRVLNATVTAELSGQQQPVQAALNFGDKNLPLRVETNFNQTQLAPFVAIFRPPDSVAINGSATGKVEFGGNLSVTDADGKRRFTTDDLKGTAQFSEFGLLFNETPFNATGPLSLRFSTAEVTVDTARFAGAGSNLVVSGTKALNEKGLNNLAVDGKVNLRILDALSRNTFFAGLADVKVNLTGSNADSRLSGSAIVDNTTVSTIVSDQRLHFERIKGRILFNTNQAQIDNLTGYLGGGKVVASGGALVEGLKLQKFRLNLRGDDVTAPLPRNYVTTGDAEVEISSERAGERYRTIIQGTIFGKRSLYTKDIDLADVIGTRRGGTIAEGNSREPLLGIPQLDLRVEGRDALFVRNNLADLRASVSLRVGGDVDNPTVTGRITATGGTLFFRNDRYEIRRGVLEFPPRDADDISINLQAESNIKGYQVVADVIGPLSDLDALAINVRSTPALPQADVVSLVTTGSLSNTETGIPTLAQSGLNTATRVLTDSLVNNPVRRATDKLFGLNRFELDPILSGRRLTPAARLTVGRQINKNLAITYSTNLSQERNQVLAFEYRVSNRLAFVAQYEQDAQNNVTRRDNFSFLIRLRKRF